VVSGLGLGLGLAKDLNMSEISFFIGGGFRGGNLVGSCLGSALI